MLSLKQVNKRFNDIVALEALDLNVGAGEVYALLGANGAGKSTTLNLLLGFLRADSGSVRVDGIDPASAPAEARARIAYLPEQVALYPTLSGAENLRYFASLAGRQLEAGELADLLLQAGLDKAAHDQKHCWTPELCRTATITGHPPKPPEKSVRRCDVFRYRRSWPR